MKMKHGIIGVECIYQNLNRLEEEPIRKSYRRGIHYTACELSNDITMDKADIMDY